MQKKTDNEIKKDLAKSVQKALIAHQFRPDKIQETMEFLGLVLGGMIGSIYQEDEHEREVARVTEHIKNGIKQGLPSMQLASLATTCRYNLTLINNSGCHLSSIWFRPG